MKTTQETLCDQGNRVRKATLYCRHKHLHRHLSAQTGLQSLEDEDQPCINFTKNSRYLPLQFSVASPQGSSFLQVQDSLYLYLVIYPRRLYIHPFLYEDMSEVSPVLPISMLLHRQLLQMTLKKLPY